MDAFYDALIDLLRALAYAAIIAVCGYASKRLKSWRSEHAELLKHLEKSKNLENKVEQLIKLNEAQNAGLREVLGRALDRDHKRLVAQGYASPSEKMAYERLYKAYHRIGGNGTRTSHYEDVMQMKSYPTERKEEP